MSDRHIPEFDGLRGLAVLAVVAHHAEHLAPELAWHTAAGRWARSGWLGVDLFFVLSGYLITRGLFGLRGGPHYYARFYGRRVLRIVPLHALYLATVFTVARERTGVAPGDAWMVATFLTNVLYVAAGPPGALVAPLWSLAVEEHFYALWPALMRHRTPAGVVRLVVAAAVLASLVRAGLYAITDPLTVYVSTPCRIDTLLVGAALAAVAREAGEDAVVAWCRARVWPAVAALLVVAGTPYGHVALAYPSRVFAAVGYLAVALACAVLVGAVGPGAAPVQWLRAPWLVHVGRVSYGVYVLHSAVGLTVASVLPRSVPRELAAVAIAAASVLVATVTWRVVERPVMALRPRLQWEATARG